MCTLYCAFNTCVSCITFFFGLAASHSSKDPLSLAYWPFASPQLNSVRWCCRGRAKREKTLFGDDHFVLCLKKSSCHSWYEEKLQISDLIDFLRWNLMLCSKKKFDEEDVQSEGERTACASGCVWTKNWCHLQLAIHIMKVTWPIQNVHLQRIHCVRTLP